MSGSNSCDLCTSNQSTWTTCHFNPSLQPLSCLSGFWLDSTGPSSVCTNCTVSNTAFATCSNETTALSCNAGYYLVGSNCLVCSQINGNWTGCSSNTTATSCVSGHYLDGNDCSDCTLITGNKVVTCNSSTVHITCVATHLPLNNTCTACSTYNVAWNQCLN